VKKLILSEAILIVVLVADELLPFANMFPHWFKIILIIIAGTAVVTKRKWDIGHPAKE